MMANGFFNLNSSFSIDFAEKPLRGEDGYSPLISVEEIDNGHRIIITDKENVDTFDILNGKDGKDGINIVDVTISEVMVSSYSVTFNGAFDWLSGGDVLGYYEVNGEELDFYAHAGYDSDTWDDVGCPPVTIDGVEILALVGDRDFFVVYKGLESGEEKTLYTFDWPSRLEIPLTEDIEIVNIGK